MDSERVGRLLEELNKLEQEYGRVPAEADANYDPSGEANARVQLLKDELAQLGAELEWDGRQYRVARRGENQTEP